MYRLLVFNPAHPDSVLTLKVANAEQVLEMIPRLVQDHPDCERVEVHGRKGVLFSVDCAANARLHEDARDEAGA